MTKIMNLFFENIMHSLDIFIYLQKLSFNPSKCQMLCYLPGAIIKIDYLMLQNKESPHVSDLKLQKFVSFPVTCVTPG